MHGRMEYVHEHRPELQRLTVKELAEIIEDEVTTPRGWVALAILYQRASKPEILNYREYLRSDAWRSVRERKLEEAGHQCMLCSGRQGLQVHHRTYDRVGKERMEDLVVLCRRCHSRHHESLAT